MHDFVGVQEGESKQELVGEALDVVLGERLRRLYHLRQVGVHALWQGGKMWVNEGYHAMTTTSWYVVCCTAQ